jgi:beta-lactamase superfamily II metal-dependent hydrolase
MNTQRATITGGLVLLVLALGSALPSGAVTPNGKLQIVHLDAGQGDAAVLISPLGQVAMIDDGGAIYPSFPCSWIVAQLDTLGITHIDYHFASHYHADHIGCFSAIDNVVHFDQGWDRAGSYGTTVYTNYVNALGARRHTLAKGQVFTLDPGSAHPVTITCIDFNGAGSDDYENAKSVMLRVDYGHFSEAFGGDLTGSSGSGSYDYETPYSSEVDTVMVYKVHHHSSKYSTNNTWLNKTAPMAAIISLGDGNPYNFPTPEALGRLHSHQVHTYWTERGSTGGASPDPIWDKIAHGRITINAVWEGQGRTVVSGGYGASAFSDTLINPGPPEEAACCDPGTGVCAVTLQTDCAPPEVWHPEWTTCSPTPCGPTGACCSNTDRTCRVLTFAQCQAGGGELYLGDGTACDPDPCPVSNVPGDAAGGAAGFISSVPNPSAAAVRLWYRLSTSEPGRLEIFDAGGRRVHSHELGEVGAGTHSYVWDGRGIEGHPVAAGVYLARLIAGDGRWTRTLIRVR